MHSGGDPQGLFDVKHTDGVWLVAVSKTLDREERYFYLLNITATDGTYETKATVEITVLDANDNSPVCEKACCVYSLVGVDRYVFFRADTDTDYYRSSRPITDISNRYTCLV